MEHQASARDSVSIIRHELRTLSIAADAA